MEERLQAQLSALVGAAVDRVVQQHGLPADGLLNQLQAAQLEASQLRQALADVQAVDDAELKRLWGVIGERLGSWCWMLGLQLDAGLGCVAVQLGACLPLLSPAVSACAQALPALRTDLPRS